MSMNQHETALSCKSERLMYGTITRGEIEEVRQLHNHAEVLTRLSDARPVNQVEQENWFKTISSSKTSYRIVIRQLISGELVGVFRIDKIDYLNQNAQVGLDIHPNFQRQGYAREAYNTLLAVLFNDWNLSRVSLETLASNSPARSLYQSLGMKEEGVGRQAVFRNGRFEDVVYYGFLRSEWLDLKIQEMK
jgi:RimJ/RimL family protein N-acetyltransferase